MRYRNEVISRRLLSLSLMAAAAWLSSAGCMRVGYDPNASGDDTGGLPAFETGLPDAIFDAAPDTASDGPVPGVDQATLTDTVDISDQHANQPCAGGVQKGTKWDPGPMQVCTGTGYVNQCDAESLCNTTGGWHLCTAAEYLARGGATMGSNADHGWLRTCVRDGSGTSQFPSNDFCSQCSSTGGMPSEDIGWTCVGVLQYSLPHHYVGVRTNYSCMRVGEDSPAAEAYWAPLNTGASNVANSAVCCPLIRK